MSAFGKDSLALAAAIDRNAAALDRVAAAIDRSVTELGRVAASQQPGPLSDVLQRLDFDSPSDLCLSDSAGRAQSIGSLEIPQLFPRTVRDKDTAQHIASVQVERARSQPQFHSLNTRLVTTDSTASGAHMSEHGHEPTLVRCSNDFANNDRPPLAQHAGRGVEEVFEPGPPQSVHATIPTPAHQSGNFFDTPVVEVDDAGYDTTHTSLVRRARKEPGAVFESLPSHSVGVIVTPVRSSGEFTNQPAPRTADAHYSNTRTPVARRARAGSDAVFEVVPSQRTQAIVTPVRRSGEFLNQPLVGVADARYSSARAPIAQRAREVPEPLS